MRERRLVDVTEGVFRGIGAVFHHVGDRSEGTRFLLHVVLEFEELHVEAGLHFEHLLALVELGVQAAGSTGDSGGCAACGARGSGEGVGACCGASARQGCATGADVLSAGHSSGENSATGDVGESHGSGAADSTCSGAEATSEVSAKAFVLGLFDVSGVSDVHFELGGQAIVIDAADRHGVSPYK